MAIQGHPSPLLGNTDPAFLVEPTVAIDPGPVRPGLDRVLDFLEKWRLPLAIGLIPVGLAVLALAYDPSPANDAGLSAGAQTDAALEPVFRGVVPVDGRPGDQAPAGPGVTTAPSPDGPSEEPSISPGPPALPSPSPDVTTTSTTEATTTTTTAPTTTTTAPTTTVATTTDRPITEVRCLVEVRRRSDVRAEPNDDSPVLGRIGRGVYAAFERSGGGEWFLIDARGTTGWIEQRSVDDVQGDC